MARSVFNFSSSDDTEDYYRGAIQFRLVLVVKRRLYWIRTEVPNFRV